MAKDMYQKREQRKNKKSEKEIKVDHIDYSNKTNINWYPGHMAKTKRLISEKLDMIDVVIEVLDARMPNASKIKDLDNLVKNKPRIIVMTKSDLCDIRETNKWVKHYEQIGYEVILANLNESTNIAKDIVNKTNSIMEHINEKRLNKGMITRKTRIMIVGIPNAGKSTLINRLVGKKAVNVGNKPGVTQSLSWIRINDDMELLDTPGILWPKLEETTVAFNLATFSAIKEEILPLDEVATYILETLAKYYPNMLKERYGIDIDSIDIEDTGTLFDMIGMKRGCRIKGGEIDYDKVITLIINDIKNGLIKGITFDRY